MNNNRIKTLCHLLVVAFACFVAATGISKEKGNRQTTGATRDDISYISASNLFNGEPTSSPHYHDESIKRDKVAVIGAGPGGMFFLHALAMKKKKLLDAGKLDEAAAMPEVTVFERASAPGGTWRDDDLFVGIWANSLSTETEFFDFTYKDFFGDEPIPVFLPRKQLLDYMIARVTSVEDIFQKVQFDTQVISVVYNDETTKFEVETKNLNTNETAHVHDFDYCIAASGNLSKPRVPKSTYIMLREGGFTGKILHACQMGTNFPVEGKRLVVVGDSYSAEDVALQALKVGAKHVYILSRRYNSEGVAVSTSSWPGNRTDVLYCPLVGVSSPAGLQCFNIDEESDTFGETIALEDIDSVIFCTGYTPDTAYLAKDLMYNCRSDGAWSVPEEWKPRPNCLQEDIGPVEPSEKLRPSNIICDDLYRCVLLIDNPRMMFILPKYGQCIPEIEAQAWLLASYVSGDLAIPSKEEMKRSNYRDKLIEMEISHSRRFMDENYFDTISRGLKGDHWMSTGAREKGADECHREQISRLVKEIARNQNVSGHGGGLGSFEQLSERGESLVNQLIEVEWLRQFPVGVGESEWRTFRDVDPTAFTSLYTGASWVPLKDHWMKLDDSGEPVAQEKIE